MHRNFYYGMRAMDVSEWKAKFMYWTVATFGPKWKLAASRVVEVERVDLDDPDTLAIAMSKAVAVARSLKTSDGEVLDISQDGAVSSSLENISRSAEQYRSVFLDRSYLDTPEKLGVLSRVGVRVLDRISGWKGDRLPVFERATLPDRASLNRVREGEQFRLNREGLELMRREIDLRPSAPEPGRVIERQGRAVFRCRPGQR